MGVVMAAAEEVMDLVTAEDSAEDLECRVLAAVVSIEDGKDSFSFPVACGSQFASR